MYPFTNDEGLNVLAEYGSYWMVNWKLVQYFNGFDEAITLAYLCSMQNRFAGSDGSFYRTIPSMKGDTTLDGRRQRKAINNLLALGLIESKSFGMPKTRHFCIRPDNMREFLRRLP